MPKTLQTKCKTCFGGHTKLFHVIYERIFLLLLKKTIVLFFCWPDLPCCIWSKITSFLQWINCCITCFVDIWVWKCVGVWRVKFVSDSLLYHKLANGFLRFLCWGPGIIPWCKKPGKNGEPFVHSLPYPLTHGWGDLRFFDILDWPGNL